MLLVPSGPLRSDAVGLKPGLAFATSAHPTRSVSLHEGPAFAPQHRAVRAATSGKLDIDAMVRARMETPTEGAGDKKVWRPSSWFSKNKKPEGEDEPTAPTDGGGGAASTKPAKGEAVSSKGVDAALSKFDFKIYGHKFEVDDKDVKVNLLGMELKTYTKAGLGPVTFPGGELEEGQYALIATVAQQFTQAGDIKRPSKDLIKPMRPPDPGTEHHLDKRKKLSKELHLDIGFSDDSDDVKETKRLKSELSGVPPGPEALLLKKAEQQEELWYETMKRDEEGGESWDVGELNPRMLGFAMTTALTEKIGESALLAAEVTNLQAPRLTKDEGFFDSKVFANKDWPWIIPVHAKFLNDNAGDMDDGKRMLPISALIVKSLDKMPTEGGTFGYKERFKGDKQGFRSHRNQRDPLHRRTWSKVVPVPEGGTGLRWNRKQILAKFMCEVYPVAFVPPAAGGTPQLRFGHTILVPKEVNDLSKYFIEIENGSRNYETALGHALKGEHLDMRLLGATRVLLKGIQETAEGRSANRAVRKRFQKLLSMGHNKSAGTGAPLLDDDELGALMAHELRVGAAWAEDSDSE